MLVFYLQAVIFTLLQLSYEPRTGPVPYTSLFYSDTSAAITQFNLLETSKVLDEKKVIIGDSLKEHEQLSWIKMIILTGNFRLIFHCWQVGWHCINLYMNHHMWHIRNKKRSPFIPETLLPTFNSLCYVISCLSRIKFSMWFLTTKLIETLLIFVKILWNSFPIDDYKVPHYVSGLWRMLHSCAPKTITRTNTFWRHFLSFKWIQHVVLVPAA